MQATYTAATVVLIGRFLPDQFHPKVLVERKAISKKDAELSNIKMVVPGNAIEFSLPWGTVLAVQDRLQISATEAPFVRIADLAVNSLQERPKGSGVTQFGINLEAHYDLGSIKARDEFACRVVPFAAWGDWGKAILESMTPDESPSHGGLVDLQLKLPFAEDRVSGYMDVYLKASTRIEKQRGVYLRSNHHHQFATKTTDTTDEPAAAQPQPASFELLDAMAERFEKSIQLSQKIFDDVIDINTKP